MDAAIKRVCQGAGLPLKLPQEMPIYQRHRPAAAMSSALEPLLCSIVVAVLRC